MEDRTLEQDLADFDEYFHGRLTKLRITIIPYPDIPHERLVQRDLGRRKPFSHSGKGYRDALIWESVLERLAATGDETTFVSNNTNDFALDEAKGPKGKASQGEGGILKAAAGESVFHPDLLADAKSRGLPVQQLRLFTGLEGFVEKEIRPALEQLKNVRQRLSDPKTASFLAPEKLTRHLHKVLVGYRLPRGTAQFPSDWYELTITEVKDVSLRAIADVRKGREGDIYVTCDLTARCDADLLRLDDRMEVEPGYYHMELFFHIRAVVRGNFDTQRIRSASVQDIEMITVVVE